MARLPLADRRRLFIFARKSSPNLVLVTIHRSIARFQFQFVEKLQINTVGRFVLVCCPFFEVLLAGYREKSGASENGTPGTILMNGC
jgi:hypothetical protein